MANPQLKPQGSISLARDDGLGFSLGERFALVKRVEGVQDFIHLDKMGLRAILEAGWIRASGLLLVSP